MNNSNHKAKKFSVALLVALLAVSTSFASVMTGCGSKSESSAASATVADTSAANAKNTTVANDKSESEVTSESSNSQSSGSESKSESAQSSEKSESSGSSDSSKANSNSNNNSSNKASNNNSGNNSGNKSNNNSSDKNNSDEKSNEDVTLDLKKGQTVTVTYSVKSTVVLTNYQAKITYDSSKLKVKTAQLQKPATSNGVINAKVAGQINFNGSDISMGYDYIIMPLSLSALKLSSVKRFRSFFISSGFSIFATFARKRIFAEFFTAFIIPSFCVCINCIVGASVLLSSPKRSSLYSKSVIMPTRSNSIAP